MTAACIDAAERLKAIAVAREGIGALMREIRKHQTALIGIAVRAYDEASAELDGLVAEPRRTIIGYATCADSPIGVCVYNDEVMGLPGQRETIAWYAEHGQATDKVVTDAWSAATHTNACLFCGKTYDWNGMREGRQMLPSKGSR
jgi:hypothetical protein